MFGGQIAISQKLEDIPSCHLWWLRPCLQPFDIETNPGPAPNPTLIQFAHLNVRSIASTTPNLDKLFLLADFISDFSIELLFLKLGWHRTHLHPSSQALHQMVSLSYMHHASLAIGVVLPSSIAPTSNYLHILFLLLLPSSLLL